MVSLLIDQIHQVWRDDIVDSYFFEFEATVIKKIPLCWTIQDDILIWAFNSDGKYTVKSGYRFLQDEQQSLKYTLWSLCGRKSGVWTFQLKLNIWLGMLVKIPCLQKLTWLNTMCLLMASVRSTNYTKRTWFVPFTAAKNWRLFGMQFHYGTMVLSNKVIASWHYWVCFGRW